MTTGQTNRVLTHLRGLARRQERGSETDAQLLERFVARREDSAFQELVRRHGPMVLGVCRRVLGQPHDAADAFQATFLVLVRQAASIVPRSGVGPWLYGVARRTALKARSSAARRHRAEQEAARGRPPTMAPAHHGGELRPLLDEELGRLPAKYSVPLVLCVLEGRSRKEAAGLLGWSEGTLSGRLARAKELLGARLRRRGVTLAGTALTAALAENMTAAAVPIALAATTVAAAVAPAGPAAVNAASVPVIALTEEVMKSMLTSKLKAAAGVLVLVAGIGLGANVIHGQSGPVVRGTTPAEANADRKEAARPEKREAKPRDYIIEPPDILFVEYASPDSTDTVRITGERLVRVDGTISLGPLGSVLVAGLACEQAGRAIAKHLASRLDGFDPTKLTVKVLAYNSKVFYMITEHAFGAEQVQRLPATERVTVLDAISQVAGLPADARKKHIWIARPDPAGRPAQVLLVDWKAITQGGNSATNYQLLPGDRLYIKSHAPTTTENGRLWDAAPEGGSDPVREFEAAVSKARRKARSPEEQRRLIDDLDALAKRLRKQLNEPASPGQEEPGRSHGP